MYRLMISLLLAILVLPSLAEEATENTPPVVPVPEQVTLEFEKLSNTSLIREREDVYSVYVRGDSLNRIKTPRVKLGLSLVDVKLRGSSLKFRWLPTSLYVFPYLKTDQFTKTGAAEVTVVHAGGAAFETKVTEYPEAVTTVTYNRAAVYGVVTANMNHIFDFGSSPLRSENARAGIGVVWTKQQPDITDGVAYDKNHADTYGNTAPSANINVKSRGIELTHSLEGDNVWFLSYIVMRQE